MHYRGQRFSVQDVIRSVANAFGGVHHGAGAGNQIDEKLFDLEREFEMGNLSAPLHSIRDIGRVVMGAMQPLARAIAEKHNRP